MCELDARCKKFIQQQKTIRSVVSTHSRWDQTYYIMKDQFSHTKLCRLLYVEERDDMKKEPEKSSIDWMMMACKDIFVPFNHPYVIVVTLITFFFLLSYSKSVGIFSKLRSHRKKISYPYFAALISHLLYMLEDLKRPCTSMMWGGFKLKCGRRHYNYYITVE